MDKNRRAIFANIERLAHIMYGNETVDLLNRAIDMWSFFTPLVLPEPSQHAVNRYLRRIHPELDPSKATVETLPNAKMAVAHYGCWASKDDPEGRWLGFTEDAFISRWAYSERCWMMMPIFIQAVLGKTSEIVRFLVKSLDEAHYKECVAAFKNIPGIRHMFNFLPETEENCVSLFVLGINGYTQRHADIKDIQGGLAGLLAMGRYKG